jgi:glycosyltransferase involved in cell wall biosynthesis
MILVSVLLPCYNAGKYLHQSLQSIFNQTYTNIEIIAIDDCSSDQTFDILKSYQLNENRLKVIKNDINLGLIKTLNKGIDIAQGEFIARMDQDDISIANRIEKQMETFVIDPHLDIVACCCIIINEKGKKLYCRESRTYLPKSNLFESFFTPPFAHPTVIIRTKTLREFYYKYSKDSTHIEDFELWSRMLMNGAKSKVLNDYLLLYRDFNANTTHRHHDIQSSNIVKISQQNIKQFLGIEVSLQANEVIVNRQSFITNPQEFVTACYLFLHIKNVFIQKTEPTTYEIREINQFYGIHLSDIIIQYLLKNKNKSFFSIILIIFRNFKYFVNYRVLKYIVLKPFKKLISET